MMMEINLLPHREARRAADLRESVALLLLGLVVVLSAIFFTHQSVKSDLATTEASVAQLEADIERYKPQQVLSKASRNRRRNFRTSSTSS